MAEILLNSVYQTNLAALQDNTLKTAATPLGYDPSNAVTSYKFISLPPDAPSFSGNNAIGVLEVTFADGSIDLYKGEISRQYKLPGNQVEAFQFYAYPSDAHGNYNKTPSATYLLDVGNVALTPNTVYKTSSDFKPAGLDAFITHITPEVPLPISVDLTDNPIPPVTPVDPGWKPGEPDVTPDPTDGKVIVVSPSTPDNPKDPNNIPHKEVIQLNNGDKEQHTVDVKDPKTPDHKPPPKTDIYVSKDCGKTWEGHKPGDKFTTGDKDTLVIVDTHNNSTPHSPHDLELVVDEGTEKEVTTAITPLDDAPAKPIPTVTPVDPGWKPGEPDVTPDPTDGKVTVVSPSTPDNPKDPNNIPHKEVIQLNNGDKEQHTVDVIDPTTPGHKPPPNTDIYVSTDGGETWEDHKPGDKFTTGDKDTLVIVDTHNNANPTNPPHPLTLVVDGGTQNEVTTLIAPLDANLHIPGGPHVDPPANPTPPIVGVLQYDDHGAICYL